MSARFTLAVAALAFAAGVASAEPPKPSLVVQTKPVSRLLAEYKEMLRQVGGVGEGDNLVKQFETTLKEALGEHGFEGFDINRPIAAYSVFREKLDDTSIVLLVPTTGEKEFVAFLERLSVKAAPVQDKKGLYSLEFPDNIFAKTSHMRFAEGNWAYLTLNDGEPTDPKTFLPPGDLFDNAEQALFAAKVYPGRVPEKFFTPVLEEIEQTAGQLKMFVGAVIDKKHLAKLATTFLDEGPKLVRRYTETALKEVTEIGLKFTFDAMTGDTLTELTLLPKAGTAFGKEVAAQGTTANRFAGFVPKDAVVGAVLKAPLFAKELREISGVMLEAGQEELKSADVHEKLKTVIDEAVKGLTRSVKAGELDAAIALVGPDKDDKFTLSVGLSFDDPTAVEKALREAAKAPDLAKDFTFDVAKVGGVGIHKVPLHRLFPEEVLGELAKVLGEKPLAHVAFAKDAVFIGFGPGSLDAVKNALEAKPGPAPAFDITANMSRLKKFATVIDPMAGMMVAKHLGTADKQVSMFRVTVEGGQALKVKMNMNVRYLPKLFIVSEAEGNVKP